jgi:hypothetical protein
MIQKRKISEAGGMDVDGSPKRSNLNMALVPVPAITPAPAPIITYAHNPGGVNARARNHANSMTSASDSEDSQDDFGGWDEQDMKLEAPDEAPYGTKQPLYSPSTGRLLGHKVTFSSAADVAVDEIIRKTRRTGLSSTAGSSASLVPYGAVAEDVGARELPPGGPHPLTDVRHGLRLITSAPSAQPLLPPPQVVLSSPTRDFQQQLQPSPAAQRCSDADYIGDAAGNIYSALPPALVNAGAGASFGYGPGPGLANAPSHQEFFALEDAPAGGAGTVELGLGRCRTTPAGSSSDISMQED